MNKEIVSLLVWIVVLGAAFGYAWYAGHLKRLAAFVAETREELRKCTWPTREELKGSTVVIVVTIALLGLFTMGVDFVITVAVRSVM
ncbi:MAG TPA: preprotein translocase subunit SecE [Candidatus Paceibacterota bacterium]|nr:preprotein translocase subunit SecE [Verrucomicrobiota bacterium]HRZ44205.1 preprotein translocase subunit SecE [Candidatus Paceibacterota bacterium]HRZ91933.1 preprotein translocase subunit SecE [Candidatus Paceibacterota bacterium]